MDIFDSEYYRINKILHRCLGCWPYQKRIEKYVRRFFVTCVILSVIIPEIIYLFNFRNNMNIVIDCLPLIMTFIMQTAKYCTYVINGDKMIKLFDTMKNNWQIISTEYEYLIMHKFAEIGRKICVATVVGYYSILFMYAMLAVTPKISDVLNPLNESRPLVYIFETDYMIDRDRYYMIIFIHHCIIGIICMTSIVAADGTYGVYAYHACGMFAIVRYELDNMIFHGKSESNTKAIINCIKKHKNAIRFCDTLESAHAVLLFIIYLMSTLCLSIIGVQIVSHLDQPFLTLRYIFLCLGHFLHIYYYSWNSQKIYDYSGEIFDAAYNAEWYELLDKKTKLFVFIMVRGSKPCVQTVGKMFPMTLITFSTLVKTSVSYFTMLSNFQ